MLVATHHHFHVISLYNMEFFRHRDIDKYSVYLSMFQFYEKRPQKCYDYYLYYFVYFIFKIN